MQKMDIMGAFIAASERGLSLEDTKASLINAGYNQQDVEDSAQAFLRGATKPTPSTKPLPNLSPLNLPSLTAALPAKITEEKKKMSKSLLIAIIATSVVFAAALGFVIFSIISK